jgi:phosphatidylserine/phosphatidylglycerophosphate/cardiolipin synthase-like enzyme
MRPLSRLVASLTLCLLALAAGAPASQAAQSVKNVTVDVYFSPRGGATDAIVQLIAQEQKTILMQAYSFTSAPIAKALYEAHKRGVQVVAVLDKSQRSEKYSGADFLKNAGITVVIDAQHAIAHNKIICLLSQSTCIGGSFNYSKAAEEQNAENMMVFHSPELMTALIENIKVHYGHSEVYEGRGEGTSAPPRRRR